LFLIGAEPILKALDFECTERPVSLVISYVQRIDPSEGEIAMGSLPGVGSFEILIVSVAGLLLLGKHLPQCVRSLKHLILDIRDGLFRW